MCLYINMLTSIMHVVINGFHRELVKICEINYYTSSTVSVPVFAQLNIEESLHSSFYMQTSHEPLEVIVDKHSDWFQMSNLVH